MTPLHGLGTVFRLTVHEAVRKRVLLAALIGGAAFLVLFGIGFHAILGNIVRKGTEAFEGRMVLSMIALAGLYAVNLLAVMTAVLLPVDTLSGEITSGVMQTVASKPVRRSSIVLGKWLAHATVAAGYVALLGGGVLAIARVLGGITLPGVGPGLGLMLLEVVLLVSVSIAGGSRLGTLTNGILAFALFGLAFVGGWIEQIGAFAANEAAVRVGIAASLIMPCDALWRLAAHHMQPALLRELQMTPFASASVPSAAMVWWAAGYALAALLAGLRGFARRPL